MADLNEILSLSLSTTALRKKQDRSPCYPGDTLVWKGKVMKKCMDGDQHPVDVKYGVNASEKGHCTGTATRSQIVTGAEQLIELWGIH